MFLKLAWQMDHQHPKNVGKVACSSVCYLMFTHSVYGSGLTQAPVTLGHGCLCMCSGHGRTEVALSWDEGGILTPAVPTTPCSNGHCPAEVEYQPPSLTFQVCLNSFPLSIVHLSRSFYRTFCFSALTQAWGVVYYSHWPPPPLLSSARLDLTIKNDHS